MIPAEVIERAREAALVDASRVETRLTMGSVDAALRSLLTDVRKKSSLTVSPPESGESLIPSGEYFHESVIDDLLRELGE